MGEVRNNISYGGFGFVFKKVSTSAGIMKEWFKVPGFVEGLQSYADKNITIDNASVLRLMEELYERHKDSDIPAGKYQMRKAMNQIRRALQA